VFSIPSEIGSQRSIYEYFSVSVKYFDVCLGINFQSFDFPIIIFSVTVGRNKIRYAQNPKSFGIGNTTVFTFYNQFMNSSGQIVQDVIIRPSQTIVVTVLIGRKPTSCRNSDGMPIDFDVSNRRLI